MVSFVGGDLVSAIVRWGFGVGIGVMVEMVEWSLRVDQLTARQKREQTKTKWNDRDRHHNNNNKKKPEFETDSTG